MEEIVCILLIVLLLCFIYHMVNRVNCGCSNGVIDGFSVGGIVYNKEGGRYNGSECPDLNETLACWMDDSNLQCIHDQECVGGGHGCLKPAPCRFCWTNEEFPDPPDQPFEKCPGSTPSPSPPSPEPSPSPSPPSPSPPGPSPSPSPSPSQDGYFQINNKTGEEIVIEVDNKAGGKLIGFFDDNKISPSNLQKHVTSVDKKYIILPVGQTMYVNVDFYKEYNSAGLCVFKNNIKTDLIDDRDCINRIEWSIKVPGDWFPDNQIWINNSLVDGYNSNMDVEVNIDGTPETFSCNLLENNIETTKSNCQSYGGKWNDGDRNKMNDTINNPSYQVAKCINPKNWLTWIEPTGYDVDKFNILAEGPGRIDNNPCPSLRSWYNNDPEYNVNGISKTRTWHKNITLNHSGKCGRAYSFPNSENFPRENIDDPMFMNNETWWCPSSVDGYKDASHIEDHLKKTDPPIFYEGDVLLRKTIPPKGTNKHNPHVIINITKVA